MIRELLDKLPSEDRKMLMYAFENLMTKFVVLEDNVFIGVNVSHLPNLKIEEEAGYWACGKVVT